MMYRVVVAGGGGIAVRHLEAMRELKELVPVAIAEIREERATELASQFGINAYTDYRVMIEKEKPDLVIIALPHFLHKEASLFAAAHGCHILLEKPMALNTQECDEIIEAVRQSGTILMVGHTQHYIAENMAAKDLVDSGKLGELVMIQDVRHVPYDRPDRPGWFFEKSKAGGGILTNLGSHSIDKIQWLTGSPVARVKASVHYGMDRGDIEGGGIVFLETAAGIPAVVMQSGYPGVPRNETELVMRYGRIRLETGSGLWVSEGSEYRQEEVPPQDEPFVLQFRELLDCMRTGREPECSMTYSRSVVAVVEAMYRSHEEGKEQVVIQQEPSKGGGA